MRWVERDEFVSPAWETAKLDIPAAAPAAADGKLRLGTYRPLWAAKEVDISPVLQFIRAKPDRRALAGPTPPRWGSTRATRSRSATASRVRANVKLRDAVPAGSVFLAEGTAENNVNVLTHGLVEIHRIGAGSLDPSAVAAQIQPAVEGHSEMPPSAPLPIPPREVT